MQNTHYWAEMHFEMSDTQAATGVSDQYEVGKIGSLGQIWHQKLRWAVLLVTAGGSMMYLMFPLMGLWEAVCSHRWWEGSVELPINWYMRGSCMDRTLIYLMQECIVITWSISKVLTIDTPELTHSGSHIFLLLTRVYLAIQHSYKESWYILYCSQIRSAFLLDINAGVMSSLNIYC